MKNQEMTLSVIIVKNKLIRVSPISAIFVCAFRQDNIYSYLACLYLPRSQVNCNIMNGIISDTNSGLCYSHQSLIKILYFIGTF